MEKCVVGLPWISRPDHCIKFIYPKYKELGNGGRPLGGPRGERMRSGGGYVGTVGILAACVTYSACVKTVACITVPACSCRTFWLGVGAIWCIYWPMKCGNTHWMLNFWHYLARRMCCLWPRKKTQKKSKMMHPFLDHSIREWLRDDFKWHFFTIPGNDRNDVGMT